MSIKKVLVPLSGQFGSANPESLEEPALETAVQLGRLLDVHVEVFCIEAELVPTRSRLAPWIPGAAMDQLLEAIAEESRRRGERAKRLFETVVERHEAPLVSTASPAGGFSLDYVEQTGQVSGALALRGRLADLIVSACGPFSEAGDTPSLLEVALRETGRPVLIARPSVSQTLGRRIAIAWNGSAEAARAVSFAMELLVRAEAVTIVAVSENGPVEPSPECLADYLLWHGVEAGTVSLEGDAASSGGIILEQAEAAGADLLVMGAYTRNRLRRVIFGSVTGEVLRRMSMPVLMVD